MKSIPKVFKSCLFKLFLLDLILLLLFKYHQPKCEPCLDDINCPPCLSEEQYFIIYFGIVVNIAICIICLFKLFKNGTVPCTKRHKKGTTAPARL